MAKIPAAAFGADKRKPRKTPTQVAGVPDKLDGRTLKRKGRTERLATRITPEVKALLFQAAADEGRDMADIVESALVAYCQ